MIRLFLALAFLIVPLPALPQHALREVRIGYLSLDGDPRYEQRIVYSGLVLNSPRFHRAGAQMGLTDLETLADVAGFRATLDAQTARDLDELVLKVKQMTAAGSRFVIVDLPSDVLDQLASATSDVHVTLINTTAHEDFLRERCYPNLLHTAASDRQLTDALAQLLRARNWTRVLELVAEQPRDAVLADSFSASATRLGLSVVDRRAVTLAADSASREQNETLLVTGGADYDVVYIADTQGEFARYLPYATQLPRPVIGATGLEAAEWHWSWDRDGATQVTSRFAKRTGDQHMDAAEWSTWIAAKAIMTAYGKSRTTDPEDIAAFLHSDRFGVDGSKGVILNFRAWDGQLRMPITLSTANAVIEEAPLAGFEHEVTALDTLGTDLSEHTCK
jgi:ABC transporter substrate binding protein (PQQ-dependent alcohol dehydrogenase system)